MKFNFDEDLKHDVHRIFNIYGIRSSPNKASREAILDFLTIREKLISAAKREVHISPLLKAKLDTHPKKKEILYIQKALVEGVNVNFFQSKRLFQPKFHDHLVYEWSIHHFHLSLIKDTKTRFVKQVDDLLFVYIDDHRAILLDTEKHKKGIFADVKWLEILHDYFPDVLAQQRDSNIQLVEPTVNNVERQALWDNGITLSPTMVRGVAYWSKGIGRTTSRHSSKVVLNTNEVLRWLHHINERFGTDGAVICDHFGLPYNSSIFRLRFGPTNLEVYEENSRRVILQYRDTLNIKKEKDEAKI